MTAREPLPLFDASSGEWYAPEGEHVQRIQVGAGGLNAAGVPLDKLAPALDPAGFRLHDLQRLTPGGNEDLRLAPQVFMDLAAPQGARPGDAPLQDEAFSSLNRSTRFADSTGRAALPGSLERLVDSEDGRYARAIAMNWVPMQRLAGEETAGATDGTQTHAETDAAKTPEDRLLGQGPEAAAVLDLLPDQAGASAAARLWLRRNSPQGGIVDELGNLGSLASLIALGRDRTELFRGREGTVSHPATWRNDARVGFASGLSAPFCIDARDAALVTDNGGPQLLAGGAQLDPDPPGPKPIKGRLHFDSSMAGRRVNESPGGALSPLSFPDGELVPVLYVTADQIGPPDVDGEGRPKPPPPPPKPPKGKGRLGGPEVIVLPPEPGPTALIGAPWFDLIPVPPTDPATQPPIGFLPLAPFDRFGGGGAPEGTGFLGGPGGAGGGGSGDQTTNMQGAAGGSSQERDEAGPATPCTNSAAAVIQGPELHLGQAALEAGEAGGSALSHLRFGPNGQFEQVNVVTAPDGRTLLAPGHVPVAVSGSVAQLGGQTGARINLVPGGAEQIVSAAQFRVPPFGAPGSGATVQDHLALLQVSQRAIQEAVLAALGGPGYYAGNLGVIHRNTPGNPPAANRVGAAWAAAPGQQLEVAKPALHVSSELRAAPGATIQATGAVSQVTRRNYGNVLDQRALVALDNGGATAPQLTATGYSLDHAGRVAAAEVKAVQLATADRSWTVRQGVQTVAQLEDHPEPPTDGTVLQYVVDDTTYMQTPDGTKTALGTVGAAGVTSLAGLTGVITDSAARAALDLEPGVDVQVQSAALDTLGAGGLAAQQFLDLEPGVDVQVHSSALDAFAVASGTDGQVLTWNSGAFSWEDPTGGGGLTSPVGVADGGTGGTTASAARTNLGLVIGTDVEAHNANLTALAALTGNSKLLYRDSGGAYVAASYGATLDALTGSSGEGFLYRNGAGWTQAGSQARSYLGSNASGVVGQQGKLDLTNNAGATAHATLGEVENTNHGGGDAYFVIDRHKASGSDGAGETIGVKVQRSGSDVGFFAIVEGEGTNTYDLGVVKNAVGTSKWISFDLSLNGPRIVSDGGLTMAKASGTLGSPGSGNAVWGVESLVPTCKVNGGATWQMVRGPAADPGDPSGFTTAAEIITWAAQLRTNLRATGAGLMS